MRQAPARDTKAHSKDVFTAGTMYKPYLHFQDMFPVVSGQFNSVDDEVQRYSVLLKQLFPFCRSHLVHFHHCLDKFGQLEKRKVSIVSLNSEHYSKVSNRR